MNIFDKRPLFLIITVLISSFVLFSYGDTLVRGVLIALAVLLLGVSLFLYFVRKQKVILVFISSISILLSILMSFLYFDVYFKLYDKYDDAVEIEGTVISVEDYGYSSSYIVKTKIINGRYSPYKIKMYISDADLVSAKPGARIKFSAKLCEFENFGDFDAKTYYFSDGISAEANEIEGLSITSYGPLPISAFFDNIRNNIVERAIDQSDYKSATLLSALLLGKRDLLSDQLKLDFKRLGITHILALSGLHLSILSFGLQRLLSIFRINKKPRLIITSVFILFYMALTGFSVSVMRAGIMILIYSALFLLGQTKDSLTSLAISVATILIISPYAVYDAALWLSALATFGIVSTSEVIEQKRNLNTIEKILSYVFSSFFVSFVATSGTLAITAYIFGTTSLLAAPATLIFSILAELIIYIGSFMLVLGSVIPIGAILIPISNFTYYLAGIMSEPDLIFIQINYPLIKVLIIVFTIAFIAFLSLHIKRKKQAMALLASLFAVILVTATVINAVQNQKDMILYSSDDNNDALVIRENSNTVLISASTYSKSLAYDNASLLSEHRIQSVDRYYITHYSRSLYTNIEKFISLIKVDHIYLPTPQNNDEKYIANNIELLLEDTKTTLNFYNANESISNTSFDFTLIHTTTIDEKNHKCAFIVENDSRKILYLSSGMLNQDTKLMALKQMADSTAVIFGCHGEKYSTSTYITAYNSKISDIIIGSLNLNLTTECLDQYLKSGTRVSYEMVFVLED